jgi:hypothetical protein
MAYDEGVAKRVRDCLAEQADITARKMFGGIAFMHGGHMCCGVIDDRLMARVGPDAYAQTLALPDVREMDFTGRPLTGYVYVDPPGFARKADLRKWTRRCLAFTGTLPAKKAAGVRKPR